MGIVESATRWMEIKAADPNCGYDQIYRWGERGDYDCSAAVITAYQQAGVPVKSYGATYTGNMYNVFVRCGFVDVTSKVNLATGAGLIRGDVLLNAYAHTAIYCGNGLEVEASINEFGGIEGGRPGDQTGAEFAVRGYRNYPWTHVLRYPESGATAQSTAEVKGSTSLKYVAQVKGVDPETLNVRIGNGSYYPNIAGYPQLGEGNMVEVCDEKGDWAYVRIANKYYGWVAKAYLQKATASQPASKPAASSTPKILYVAKVNGVAPDTLNVRTGAGNNYPIYSAFPALGEGNLVEVLAEQKDSFGNKWCQVWIARAYKGYVYSAYLKKV